VGMTWVAVLRPSAARKNSAHCPSTRPWPLRDPFWIDRVQQERLPAARHIGRHGLEHFGAGGVRLSDHLAQPRAALGPQFGRANPIRVVMLGQQPGFHIGPGSGGETGHPLAGLARPSWFPSAPAPFPPRRSTWRVIGIVAFDVTHGTYIRTLDLAPDCSANFRTGTDPARRIRNSDPVRAPSCPGSRLLDPRRVATLGFSCRPIPASRKMLPSRSAFRRAGPSDCGNGRCSGSRTDTEGFQDLRGLVV